MHNIKWIRDNPKAFDEAMNKRNIAPVASEIIARDKEKRAQLSKLQELQQESNELAKKIGMLKSKGGDASDEISRSKQVKSQLAKLKEADEKAQDITTELLDDLLYTLPNILSDDVPNGDDESDNQEIYEWGEKRDFDFTPREHFDIGEDLGLLDFETSAKISGSRFSILKGDLARLERALINFMLDMHSREYGYEEYSVPMLVNSSAMFGTTQLPKFAEDAFITTDDKWLIPTTEVPLVNSVREKILNSDDLPIRLTAHSVCFRSEAGSAGRDTRGLIRQHQFHKVELISITSEQDSASELERITNIAEEVLKRLEIPYRKMLLCSGDTGFASVKTYDLEAWLPGQGKYREISSCSNCQDFQSRRMKTRYRSLGEKETKFVHTLNGSGLAIGRTIVAILENYQQEDGTVAIPSILHNYMGGKTVIG